MPRRSNAFQKLVLHIHRVLANDATVTESELLPDHRHGGTREVDVVVRSTIAGHAVTISIEATASTRAADVEWVEQMLKKHECLPTNRLVLVSETGFSERARKVAQAAGASALSLAEAEELNWTEIVGKEASLEYQRYDFDPREVIAVLRNNSVPPQCELQPETMLCDASGAEVEPALTSVLRALRDPRFGPQAMERANGDNINFGSLEYSVEPAVFVRIESGELVEIRCIRVGYAIRRLVATVPLRHGSWSGTPVAFGTAATPMGKVALTVVETSESGPSVTITSPNPYSGKEETQPTMRIKRESSAD